MMEIDYSALPDVQELKRLLQDHLIIGKTTVKDTQEFLRQQNLACSEEIKQFTALFKTNMANQLNIQFDSYIGCKIPIKPKRISTRNPLVWFKAFLDSRLVTWDYMVDFYFFEGILIEIITERRGTGF